MSAFTLPSLRYQLNELEPVIDALTMDKHYNKHHQAYIDNLNKALNDNPNNSSLVNIFKNSSGELDNPAVRNNGGGHYNHELYWDILSPISIVSKTNSTDLPVVQKMISQFESVDSVKLQFETAGLGRFGSGWAWVCVDNTTKDLKICSTPNQDNPLMNLPGIEQGTPIIGIDVWEHAYYLKYQNLRKDYLQAVWSLLDWNRINDRYVAAIK